MGQENNCNTPLYTKNTPNIQNLLLFYTLFSFYLLWALDLLSFIISFTFIILSTKMQIPYHVFDILITYNIYFLHYIKFYNDIVIIVSWLCKNICQTSTIIIYLRLTVFHTMGKPYLSAV